MNTKNKSLSRPHHLPTQCPCQGMEAAPRGNGGRFRRYSIVERNDVKASGCKQGGNSETVAMELDRTSVLRGIPYSSSTCRSLSDGVAHRRTSMSATPGQKKKAYAVALPQKATRLAAAFRKDILSTTKAICAKRFWMNMLRTL